MKEMIARVGDYIKENGIPSVCITSKEIIRCQYCKHMNSPDNCVKFCNRIHNFVTADWYCADGERRNGDE